MALRRERLLEMQAKKKAKIEENAGISPEEGETT